MYMWMKYCVMQNNQIIMAAFRKTNQFKTVNTLLTIHCILFLGRYKMLIFTFNRKFVCLNLIYVTIFYI